MTKCQVALETAAKYAVQSNDQQKKKEGYALLLERAFPSEPDKAEQLDAVLRALRELSQIGSRHGTYPARHVSYEEARFVLVTTLSVFALISKN